MDTTRHDAGPGVLSPQMLAGDPMTQFAQWMAQAQALPLPEPTAMVLATVSDQGRPRACVVFPWYPMQRQVTAEGPVTPLSQADSEPYYRSRPRGSQIGAWASRQSRVIGSRADLDDRAAELEQRWAPPATIPMPDFWGGYLLEPETVEFWQAGRYRLHDRLRYRREGGSWVIERLSP